MALIAGAMKLRNDYLNQNLIRSAAIETEINAVSVIFFLENANAFRFDLHELCLDTTALLIHKSSNFE